MQLRVAPSVLSADFLHLEKDILMLNDNADWIHLDVMDGTFVPNMSFGFSVIDAIAPIAKIPMDVHFMVVHPERWFKHVANKGVEYVSFHLEAAGRNTGKYIDELHSLGLKAGVAIDPDIPVKRLFKYIGKADFFLIMSVFAGFGGQKFIYESIDRVAELKAAITKAGSNALIEVDGGVAEDNAAALKEAGADVVVAGSSVFKSDSPENTIKALQRA